MKVNFEIVLKALNGEVINGADDKPATLKGVTTDVLVATFQDEQNLSGEDKVKRWDLALRIYNGLDELNIDEVVLIKKLVGKAYGPVVVGQVWKILEGK